jgi:hypothetical protein
MALENDNSLVMPVSPLYGGGNGGFGGFGGDWGSLIVLFLIAAMFGGFGNGFGGGFGGGYDGGAFPWLMSGQQGINSNTNDGFRDQMLQTGITSIRDGIGDLSTQLCNSTANIQMGMANGFSGVEQGANARQIANMQTAFGLQNAMNQGFNQLGSQFADCCCEQRLASCQTQNIIQNEGNQTRFADANNTRDLLTNQTANTQAILDKLCQLELDGKNDRIADLERQLTMANLQASQTAQNSLIQRGFSDEVDALYNRLNNCPVPTTPVYGRTPIFTCNNNNGCGCGCGNF